MRFATMLLLPGFLVLYGSGCAAHAPRPDAAAREVDGPAKASRDQFRRDQAGGLSEEALQGILEAPVGLDGSRRLGVLPVTDSYRPDRSVPVPAVPAELTRSLDAAGLFQATSEVAADWPSDGDVPGLRELAARYRCGYLILYRQRFVDDEYLNAWSWLYATVVGVFVAPGRTLETAGVLEATLFDVRTGTILFTVYQRVHTRSEVTAVNEERKLSAMKARLVEEAAGKLAEQVVAKVRGLAVAAREKRPGSDIW